MVSLLSEKQAAESVTKKVTLWTHGIEVSTFVAKAVDCVCV
jgi:hypothetical protein